MAGLRRSVQDGRAVTAALMLAMVAAWYSPALAEEEAKLGIEIGVEGGEIPFLAPLVAKWFHEVNAICDEGECRQEIHLSTPCTETRVSDVVAHFCTGAEGCGVCPSTVAIQEVPLANFPNPWVDTLIEALSVKAGLEAEIQAHEHFAEQLQELNEKLVAKEIENAELRAALVIAEQRHEFQQHIAEINAENSRLQAQVELAQQKEKYIEQYAKAFVENEKLKLHVASVEQRAEVAEQARAKVAKVKSKAKVQTAKSKAGGKVAKRKQAAKDLRTAKRPAKEVNEGDQAR